MIGYVKSLLVIIEHLHKNFFYLTIFEHIHDRALLINVIVVVPTGQANKEAILRRGYGGRRDADRVVGQGKAGFQKIRVEGTLDNQDIYEI